MGTGGSSASLTPGASFVDHRFRKRGSAATQPARNHPALPSGVADARPAGRSTVSCGICSFVPRAGCLFLFPDRRLVHRGTAADRQSVLSSAAPGGGPPAPAPVTPEAVLISARFCRPGTGSDADTGVGTAVRRLARLPSAARRGRTTDKVAAVCTSSRTPEERTHQLNARPARLRLLLLLWVAADVTDHTGDPLLAIKERQEQKALSAA